MARLIVRYSVSESLREMGKGEEIDIPTRIAYPSCIRAIASSIGKKMGRRYSVHYKRSLASSKVTRYE